MDARIGSSSAGYLVVFNAFPARVAEVLRKNRQNRTGGKSANETKNSIKQTS